MAPARILIITSGPLCRNPRVFKEASTLGRAGHAVTVLTVRNHVPSEILDLKLLRDAPFQRQTVDTVAGFSPGRFRPFYHRLVQWLARKSTAHLHRQSAAALGPAGALLRQARRIPADLVIVHNEVAHWVGTRLIAEGRRVCADFEDWHSEDLLPEQRSSRPLALLRQVERTLLHQAVYTTTTSHALADALHARYGGHRPHVITNAFPLQADPNTGQPGKPPAFFWFSQTIGPGRGLEQFLAAWSRMSRPSRLVLLGEPVAGYMEQLLLPLSEQQRSRLTVLPPVSPEELPTVIARHDIGLALEQSFIPNRDLTITNKIIQYLNAGLVVLASDTAGQREVLEQSPDAGLVVPIHETTRLTHELDSLLADSEMFMRRRRAARRLAETTYCWERESPRLIGFVSRALSA